MSAIELPRPLHDYFAYAETEPTRRGRRFSITLTYYIGERLDRIQWWYHVSPAEEQMFDGKGIAVLRGRATERFKVHIERWLHISQQRLHGDDPIPRVTTVATAKPEAADDPTRENVVVAWPAERVANAS